MIKVHRWFKWCYVDCRVKILYKLYWAKKRSCLNLYYIGSNSYTFVNAVEIYKFKAKGSWINKKDDSVDIDNFLHIHKYLIKMHDIK